MNGQQEKATQTGDDLVLIENSKRQILESLDNVLIDLKRTVRRSIWIATVIQYLAFVGSVWAVLHYLYLIK